MNHFAPSVWDIGDTRIRSARESNAIIAAARAARNDVADFAPELARTPAEIEADERARRKLATQRKPNGPCRSAFWKGG